MIISTSAWFSTEWFTDTLSMNMYSEMFYAIACIVIACTKSNLGANHKEKN